MESTKKLLAQSMLLTFFLALSISFLAYSKRKVTGYLYLIQTQTAKLQNLQSLDSAEGMKQVQNLIITIKPVMQKATYYTYIIVPLIMLILWAALIGTLFYLYPRTSKSYGRYIMEFAAISPLPLLAATCLLFKIMKLTSTVLSSGSSFMMLIVYLLLFIVLSYIMFVTYITLGKHHLKRALLETPKIAVRKGYILFPLFAILMVVVIAIISILFTTYLSLISGNLWPSLAYNLIAFIITTAAAVMLSSYMSKIINENPGSP